MCLALRAPIALEDGGHGWFDLEVDPDGLPAFSANAARRAARLAGGFARAAQRTWQTDPTRAALVGYSQGGGVAAAVALVEPGPFRAVAAVSGSVAPEHLAWALDMPSGVAPLFVAHGTLDSVVPAADVRRQTHALAEAGADATYPESAAPHVVTAEPRGAMAAWLRPRLAPRR